jgi:hypothetical protein
MTAKFLLPFFTAMLLAGCTKKKQTAITGERIMMPGHLMEWFYSGLAGIYQADNSVAYDHIIIAPKPAGNNKWVKCSYNSSKGMISSEWGIKGNSFAFNLLYLKIPRQK